MRLKYAFRAVTAALLAVGCTEPSGRYFEGTITYAVTLNSALDGSWTLFIGVDNSPAANSLECEGVDIRVTPSTRISFAGLPPRNATAADLAVGQVIRVTPPFSFSDGCPTDIAAVDVSIVKS